VKTSTIITELDVACNIRHSVLPGRYTARWTRSFLSAAKNDLTMALNRSGYDKDRVVYIFDHLSRFVLHREDSFVLDRWHVLAGAVDAPRLYQSTHSNVASSTSSGARHDPLRLMSSVL
jgi:hypothetical protein